MLHCFMFICTYSWIPYTSNNDGSFQQENVSTDLSSILETSNKWYSHYIHSTWSQLSIYRTWWRGIFTHRIFSTEQLSRQHGLTSSKRYANQLWNWYHIALLHFAIQYGALHNSKHLPWLLAIITKCKRKLILEKAVPYIILANRDVLNVLFLPIFLLCNLIKTVLFPELRDLEFHYFLQV